MRRWATMAMMTAALGVTAQGAEAQRARHQHAPRPHSSQLQHGQSRYFQHPQKPPQSRPHRHHRPFSRPATGIVVVPGLAPRFLYYAPMPVYLGPPAYVVPPATVAPPATAPAHGYAPDGSPYWYFCPDSRRYYPEARECASGCPAVVAGVPVPTN